MSKNYMNTQDEKGQYLSFTPVSDYQRRKVYNAEFRWIASMWNEIELDKRGCPNGRTVSPDADPTSIFYRFPSTEAVEGYLLSLCGQEWMRDEFGLVALIRIRHGLSVHVRRGDKFNHAKDYSIYLSPKHGFRKDTVLHEFAHVVVNALDGVDGGHGRLFAKTHLTLIRHAVSADASHLLRYIYDKLGVKYTEDDRVFANEKIKKQNKAIANGLVMLSHDPHKDTFSIDRFPAQKIQTKAVPIAIHSGYIGLGRWTEWNHETYNIDGQSVHIHWEMRWGKYGYFCLTNEDGSVQWYKFRMQNDKRNFYPDGVTDRYMFTPAFAKGRTEDELVALTRTMMSK